MVKFNSFFVYFNMIYATALISFLTLFFFKIEIIFLTNFTIIVSLILLISNLLCLLSIRKTIQKRTIEEKQKYFSLKFAYYILTYIIPIYCIAQEPKLVISHNISSITFTIVTILAIIGMFLERWLFFIEEKHTVGLYNENNEL